MEAAWTPGFRADSNRSDHDLAHCLERTKSAAPGSWLLAHACRGRVSACSAPIRTSDVDDLRLRRGAARGLLLRQGEQSQVTGGGSRLLIIPSTSATGSEPGARTAAAWSPPPRGRAEGGRGAARSRGRTAPRWTSSWRFRVRFHAGCGRTCSRCVCVRTRHLTRLLPRRDGRTRIVGGDKDVGAVGGPRRRARVPERSNRARSAFSKPAPVVRARSVRLTGPVSTLLSR